MDGGVSVGNQLVLGAALGILAKAGQPMHRADAIQLRIIVTNLRLSLVLSKRQLSLRQLRKLPSSGY
jgi:hypothetical protein